MEPMDATPTTPVVASTEVSSSASTPAAQQQQQDDPRNKGISPIKPEYLIPSKKPNEDESLSHLSEAIEAQGDQGRVEGGGSAETEEAGDDRNQNHKRDRDQVKRREGREGREVFWSSKGLPVC